MDYTFLHSVPHQKLYNLSKAARIMSAAVDDVVNNSKGTYKEVEYTPSEDEQRINLATEMYQKLYYGDKGFLKGLSAINDAITNEIQKRTPATPQPCRIKMSSSDNSSDNNVKMPEHTPCPEDFAAETKHDPYRDVPRPTI